MNLYNKNDFASSVETYSAAEESKLILSLYTGIGTANFWEGFMERFAALAGQRGDGGFCESPERRNEGCVVLSGGYEGDP